MNTYTVLIKHAEPDDPALILGTPMLQSAIFADLQVNNFGIPTVRFIPRLPRMPWSKSSFAQLASWLRHGSRAAGPEGLSEHLRRDIGLQS